MMNEPKYDPYGPGPMPDEQTGDDPCSMILGAWLLALFLSGWMIAKVVMG